MAGTPKLRPPFRLFTFSAEDIAVSAANEARRVRRRQNRRAERLLVEETRRRGLQLKDPLWGSLWVQVED